MLKTKSIFSRHEYNAKLHVICNRACLRLDELIDELGLDLYEVGNKFQGSCPIHGGDGGSFRLYKEGNVTAGNWECLSHHCERHFRSSLCGFVQGVISHHKYGWEKEGQEEAPFRDAVKFICDFLKVKFDDIKVDLTEIERRNFINSVADFNTEPLIAQGAICGREEFRKHLSIPSRYFLKRGFAHHVLDSFDVGYCGNPSSDFFGRHVVPVYDKDHKMVMGVLGRTPNDKCKLCNMYHGGEVCPPKGDRRSSGKWLVSKDFRDKNWLYNLWGAKESIYKSRCMVVVEGPGDVWKLVEAGIRNAVAIFGSSVSDRQEALIQMSGANVIVCLTDNDEAGRTCHKMIEDKFSGLLRVYRPEFHAKDIGEMDVQDIQDTIKPFVEGKMRR